MSYSTTPWFSSHLGFSEAIRTAVFLLTRVSWCLSVSAVALMACALPSSTAMPMSRKTHTQALQDGFSHHSFSTRFAMATRCKTEEAMLRFFHVLDSCSSMVVSGLAEPQPVHVPPLRQWTKVWMSVSCSNRCPIQVLAWTLVSTGQRRVQKHYVGLSPMQVVSH